MYNHSKMKKIFFIISLFLSLAACGQVRFFMLAANGSSGSSGGSSGGTPIYWWVHLADQYQSQVDAPAGWNVANNTGGTALGTPGGVNMNLIKSDGTSSSVYFTNVTTLNGTRSAPTQGSNHGVFPDFIETQAWEFANGNQVKFTGLDNAKQYTIYVHGNAQNWESGTINFSVGGSTSGNITTANNVGGSTYPNWESDPALIKIINISPSSGTITITVNVISGLGMVDAIVLKQQ